MSDNSMVQHNAQEGTLEFIDYHRPNLEAGLYKLKVQQKVKAPNKLNQLTESSVQEFIVDTPRFDLPAGLMHSHYPPKGGKSDYDGVVPSISFNQPTFPWERSPDVSAQTPDGASWLAIILVDEDDVKDLRARESFKDLVAQTPWSLAEVKDQLGIDGLENWVMYPNHKDMPVNILELQKEFYQDVMPAYGDLQWLSHTRFSHNKEDDKHGELTYVLGNRLPTPGQNNTAYLVSLEHRYADTEDGTTAGVITGNEYQRLVYLYKWDFFCRPGVMYSYTVTKEILQLAKTKFETINIPDTLPGWIGQEFDGEEGKEALRDFLLNTYEITNVGEAAKEFILTKSKKGDHHKLTPKIFRDVKEKQADIEISELITIGKTFIIEDKSDSAKEKERKRNLRPSWVKYDFEGEEGKQHLIEFLEGSHLIKGIGDKAAEFILNKGKKAEGTFRGILETIDATSLRTRLQPGLTLANPTANKLLASGRSILKHHLRSGGKTFSWFKGPPSPAREEDKGFTFPVNSSDELLIFHQDTGMLDTTYSSAWTLGRLLGLEQKAVSTELFHWRHNQRQLLMIQQHDLDHGHLHLEPPAEAELPEKVIDKLDQWKRLQGIPFNYLIPSPSLLPEESMRFFHLDPNWMCAFLDGFFSLGKVHGLDDRGEEYEHFPSFKRPVTGILLRSDALAGWPAMHIDAHAERLEGTDYDLNPDHLIPILRIAGMGSGVMLILFDGIPKTVDIYLSPEALHSGFTPEFGVSETVTYKHSVSDPITGKDWYENEELVEVPLAFINERYRVFSPKIFSQTLEGRIRAHENDATTSFKMSPGYFGLELIEGTPMVRFQLEEVVQGSVIPVPVSSILPKAPPATASSVKPDQEDDLTRIKGVGAKYSTALKASGYKSFDSIATASPEELDKALEDHGYGADTSGWPDEARKFAK